MVPRMMFVCLAASLAMTPASALATPHWDRFERQGCNGDGIRQWASKLLDAGDWIPDCRRTPADVAGAHFAAPSRCKSDPFHVWGEFDVADASCSLPKPHWDRFEAQGCTRSGIRQWAAKLLDAHDWIPDCQRTAADVSGQHFAAPSRCKNDPFHVWGEFDVADAACAPHWDRFEKQGCSGFHTRQWASKLLEAHDWIPDCQRTAADVGGVHFGAPSRCKSDPLHVWGEFDVSDDSCPHWGAAENKECRLVDVRTWAATLLEAHDWIPDCQRSPADVAGSHFGQPSRCLQDVTHVWGEFDVRDTGCEPHFTEVQAAGCEGAGKRSYTARLDGIPVKEDPDAVCNRKRWTITVQGKTLAPDRCQYFVNGEMGYFSVADSSCQATRPTDGGSGNASCSGFSSVRFTNATARQESIWLYDNSTSMLSNKGHLAAGQALDVKLPTSGDVFFLYAIDLTAVQAHNQSFPQDKVDADSSDPQTGAVFASQYYAEEPLGPLIACSSGGSFDTATGSSSGPARQPSHDRSTWKVPAKR